jgi:hypothetical protein
MVMVKHRQWSIAAFAVVVSTAASAEAQPVSWQSSVQFDWGYQPVAATNGLSLGLEVEEHLGGQPYLNSNQALWGNMGSWSAGALGGGMEWSGPSGTNQGFWQTVAGDSSSSSSLFVRVFDLWDARQEWPHLMYATGTASAYGTTNWNDSASVYTGIPDPDWGFNPSIAQASMPGYGTQFIIFYQDVQNGCLSLPCGASDTLAYRTGTLNADGQSITWGPKQEWSGGDRPSVAIIPYLNGQFFVVDAHQGQAGSGSLWMDFGVLQYGSSTVQWTGHTTQYDNGATPSVAICTEPHGPGASIIEVHNGGWGSSAGWYRTGRIYSCPGYFFCYSNLAGDWAEFDAGQNVYNPTVACNQYWGYEVHQDSTTGGGLHQTKFTIN